MAHGRGAAGVRAAMVLVLACLAAANEEAKEVRMAVLAEIGPVDCAAWRGDVAATAEMSAAVGRVQSGRVDTVHYECGQGVIVVADVTALDYLGGYVETEMQAAILLRMRSDPMLAAATVRMVGRVPTSTCYLMGSDLSVLLGNGVCYPVRCNAGLARRRLDAPPAFRCTHPSNLADPQLAGSPRGYALSDTSIVLMVVFGMLLALLCNWLAYNAYRSMHPEEPALDGLTAATASTSGGSDSGLAGVRVVSTEHLSVGGPTPPASPKPSEPEAISTQQPVESPPP